MIQIVGDSPEAKAGRAEIARLAWKAKRYDELTQALARRGSRDLLLTSDTVQVGSCEDFDYDHDPVAHDGTPDGIAAAIIEAAREVQ